jgi:hypothetical protein
MKTAFCGVNGDEAYAKNWMRLSLTLIQKNHTYEYNRIKSKKSHFYKSEYFFTGIIYYDILLLLQYRILFSKNY